MADDQFITLTADIVSAHVANNSVAVGDVANLVAKVHGALAGLAEPETAAEPEPKTPIVSVRASVKSDFIVCMECGSKHKMLKRHLQNVHSMSPDEYRADYGLPSTYPMVAPNYSEQRRTLAKASGLGRKKNEPAKGHRAREAKTEAPGD